MISTACSPGEAVQACTHTRTRVHMRTRRHTHECTQAHVCAHACTRMHTGICTHVHVHTHAGTHMHACRHTPQPLAEAHHPGLADYRPLSPGKRLVPVEQAGGTGPIRSLQSLPGIDLQMLRQRSFLSAKLAGSKSGTANSHISPSLESRRRKLTARGR